MAVSGTGDIDSDEGMGNIYDPTSSWYEPTQSDVPCVSGSASRRRRRRRTAVKATAQGIEHAGYPSHAQTPNPAWMRVAQIALGLIALGACITIVALCITGAFANPLYIPLIVTGIGLVASFALFCYLTYRIDCRENYAKDHQVQKAYRNHPELLSPHDVDRRQAIARSSNDDLPLTRPERRRNRRKRPSVVLPDSQGQPRPQEGGSTLTEEQNRVARQEDQVRLVDGEVPLRRRKRRKRRGEVRATATTNFRYIEVSTAQQLAYQQPFDEQDFASIYQAHLVDLRLGEGTKPARLTPVPGFNGIHAEIPALLQYDVRGSVYYQTPLVVRLPKEYIQNMSIPGEQKQALIASETEFFFIVYRSDPNGTLGEFNGSRRNLSFHGPILASREDKQAELHANIPMGMLYAKGVQPLPSCVPGTSIPMGRMQKQPQSAHPVGTTGEWATSPNNAAFLVSDEPVDTFFACAKLDSKADRSMAVFGVVLNDVNQGDGQVINDALMVNNLDAFYRAIAGELSDQDVLGGIGAALNLPYTAPAGAGVGL